VRQDVELAEPLLSEGDAVLPPLEIGDVQTEELRTASCCAYRLHVRTAEMLIHIRDDDACTLRGEQRRSRRTDALRSTGDDGGLVRESRSHQSAPSAVGSAAPCLVGGAGRNRRMIMVQMTKRRT